MNNFRKFLLKVVILAALIFLSRAAFQFPVEYFGLDLLQQGAATTVFNKILALEIFTLVAIFFGLYFKVRIEKVSHPKVNTKKTILAFISAELAIAIYYGIRLVANANSITSGFWFYATWILSLVMLCISLFYFLMAVFDYRYCLIFFRGFKKEIMLSAVIAIILYFMLFFFQEQWFFFSSNVSAVLYSALSNYYPTTYSIMNGVPILDVNGFAVGIGAPCSGIDSLFLFFAFFAAIFALDRKKLKKGIYILFFFIGLIGVYFLNILRLLLLIIVGVEFSPDFAVGLFHTNVGWLLFVIYFLCYYLVIKRFIYTKTNTRTK